jgi:hypothetical protein
MTQVFIAYKREDETRVGRIARALEATGFEVWWDRGLPSGESWQVNIETNLNAAGCVVVVWSAESVAPEGSYVRDEARRGLARNILVPVLIDTAKTIPLGFGETQAIDLRQWKGDQRDPFFQDLVAAVRSKLEGTPAPKAKGPAARVAHRLFVGATSTAFLATLAAFAFVTFNLASTICGAPGFSDTCGAVHLGGQPSRAERMAWSAIPSGSCPALREYVARFPESPYRREAADMVTARRVTYVRTCTPTEHRLVLNIPSTADDAAAKTAVLRAVQPDADRLCQSFGSGTLFRYISAKATVDGWNCARGLCTASGWAVCAVDQCSQVEMEACGPQR